MKLQWKSVSEEQEKRNSRLRDYRSLIGKFRFRTYLMVQIHTLLQFSIKLKKCSRLSYLYEEALQTNMLLFSEVSELHYILNTKNFLTGVIQSFTQCYRMAGFF